MNTLCGFPVGLGKPFFLIAGPCVIESEALALETAGQLKQITEHRSNNTSYSNNNS